MQTSADRCAAVRVNSFFSVEVVVVLNAILGSWIANISRLELLDVGDVQIKTNQTKLSCS